VIHPNHYPGIIELRKTMILGGVGVIRVDQYQLIRHLYAVEGASQREIAKRLGISRNTVRRYCSGENFPWERQKPVNRQGTVITQEVREFVQNTLDQDKTVNRKQRHTARRIYDRLRDEMDFRGGESTIRHLVRQLKAKQPEVYVPLAFAPGEAAQVDWGTATVIIAGQKAEANLFCMRLCFSCTPFVMAFPSQREEAFLEGHQQAFNYFGGVTRTIIYDNLKTAVKDGWGKLAKEQQRFSAFRAHHAYESRFCNPSEGHEKGLVENLVGYIRRNVLVPIPEVSSWEELNQLLLKRCQRYREEHHIRGREIPVRDSYAIEKAALTTLPVKPYEAVKMAEPKVDYFSTVSFEGNRYSVPVKWTGQTVTLKASSFWVDIYHRSQRITRHRRCYKQRQTIYDLAHYLPLLEMKPRSVYNARPVREANLPDKLWQFAQRLKNPDQGMVQLLRLVVNYGTDRVMAAVKRAVQYQQNSVEVVRYYILETDHPVLIKPFGPAVKPVDLGQYDCLLAGGGLP
jgi:transposase